MEKNIFYFPFTSPCLPRVLSCILPCQNQCVLWCPFLAIGGNVFIQHSAWESFETIQSHSHAIFEHFRKSLIITILRTVRFSLILWTYVQGFYCREFTLRSHRFLEKGGNFGFFFFYFKFSSNDIFSIIIFTATYILKKENIPVLYILFFIYFFIISCTARSSYIIDALLALSFVRKLH